MNVYGVEVVESTERAVLDTEGPASVKARDKRSGLVNRKRTIRQLLCFVCCGEFGTTSLTIHIKTCLKKYMWALDLIEFEEGTPKK